MNEDSKGVIPFSLLLILTLVAFIGIGYWAYKNRRTKINPQQKPIPTSTLSTDMSDWKTYKNEEFGFEIKYPKEFILSENTDVVRIYSKPYQCETENTPAYLPRIKIDASEIKIEFIKIFGSNFQNIWKNSFGSKLEEVINGVKQQNYDCVEYFDGKIGYYFHQGAEMTFGRKAILVEKDNTSAIQIDS